MSPQRFAVLPALCGALVLIAGLGSPSTDNAGAPTEYDLASVTARAARVDAQPASAMASVSALATSHLRLPEPRVAPAAMSADAATVDPEPRATAYVLASVSPTELPVSVAALPESDPTPPSETRVKLVSLFAPAPANEVLKPAAPRIVIPHDCLVAEVCIDDYLWAMYERTPKIDTNKVTERIKTKVKKKGKIRTVIKTITKYVLGDFTWKDPIAAKRAGMGLKEYVIGGMDRGFRLKLFHALRKMEDAGLMPGITSAFRDDYRQAIAVGNKAASDSSFHGGSRRGGYGHGLAVDLVSVRGDTRMQRWVSTVELWKWIDANEKELGVGRPYLDRDPPHVVPIDGKEYAAKRGRANAQKAAVQTKTAPKTAAQTKTAPKAALQPKTAQKAKVETKKRPLVARNDPGPAKPAKPAAKPAKVSSVQNRASVQR
jgi:hypothetical protein